LENQPPGTAVGLIVYVWLPVVVMLIVHVYQA